MTSVTGTSATSNSNGLSASTATSQIGPQANQTLMNQFLTMLTTELKNQDPTQPTDPTQFVGQLAQFSTVEQLTQSNSTLNTISSSLNSTALGQYSGLIGQTVTAPSSSVVVPSSGSVSADLTFAVTNSSASNPYVAVTDANGNVVSTIPVSGTSGTVTFNGTDANGNSLPPGQYNVALVAPASNGTSGATVSAGTLTTNGTVSSITQDMSGNWELQMADGQLVKASSVSGIN
jgi:flagellar basal-body rod modification protein FlgD